MATAKTLMPLLARLSLAIPRIPSLSHQSPESLTHPIALIRSSIESKAPLTYATRCPSLRCSVVIRFRRIKRDLTYPRNVFQESFSIYAFAHSKQQ